MTEILLSAYVLVWPVIVAGVLFVLVRAFLREIREARKDGRPMI
ncbi:MULTISPECIES: putative transporter small subunit [Paracoccus]|nr:putative transporter small subunit [Paracoccus onubensis]MDP0925793.1 putative transporter small subunit [Paracoccus onubensis]